MDAPAQAQGFSFRLATVADAAALSEFAARVFMDTFAKDNTPEDVDAYLRATFSPELQAREITAAGGFVLLARQGDAELIGYAHLMRNEAERPNAIAGDGEVMEVRRFYVAPAWHGRGLAKALMMESIRQARTRDVRALWLGVWEHNPRAIAFYRKLGFREVGSHPFQLGSDVQTDLLMAFPLDPRTP